MEKLLQKKGKKGGRNNGKLGFYKAYRPLINEKG